MGWNYVFQWAIVLPLELVVAAITMGFWESAQGISIAVWVTLFLVLIVIINVFGVIGYAEEEFWSSIAKLFAVVIFMIMGLVFGKFKRRS
jgi:amino acid transporter